MTQALDIRQLRYFVQIVEYGSLSKAARYLYIAQPALSQQIAKLEDIIGKPLLVRSSKGVTPTSNGEALYHHAKQILRQLEQTITIARSEIEDVSGMVSIGLPATTIAAIGLTLVNRIRERYPKILLNVVEGMSGHIAQMMRHDQLDLAVLFSKETASEFDIEPLLTEELFVMLPMDSNSVPAEKDGLTMAEIAELPLVLPTGSHGLRQRIAAEFESRGLPINVVAEIDSLSLLMDFVYDGGGATIKPLGAVMREEMRNRNWRYLKVADAHLRRQNFLYSVKAERKTLVVSSVMSELRMIVEELINDDHWPGFERVLTEPEANDLMLAIK